MIGHEKALSRLLQHKALSVFVCVLVSNGVSRKVISEAFAACLLLLLLHAITHALPLSFSHFLSHFRVCVCVRVFVLSWR